MQLYKTLWGPELACNASVFWARECTFSYWAAILDSVTLEDWGKEIFTEGQALSYNPRWRHQSDLSSVPYSAPKWRMHCRLDLNRCGWISKKNEISCSLTMFKFPLFLLSFIFPCKNTAVVYMLKKYHKNRIYLWLHRKVSSRSQSNCKLWHHTCSCPRDPVSLWKSAIVTISCYFISAIQVQMILWEFC